MDIFNFDILRIPLALLFMPTMLAFKTFDHASIQEVFAQFFQSHTRPYSYICLVIARISAREVSLMILPSLKTVFSSFLSELNVSQFDS